MGSIKGYVVKDNGKKYQIHHREFQKGRFRLIFSYCTGTSNYRMFNDVLNLSILDETSRLYGVWNRYFLEINHLSVTFEYRNN